jgi:short-subunit dehydrogenase
MNRLEGRTVVVTGAAGGIGNPLAGLLAAEGARVVSVDRAPCTAAWRSEIVDLADDAALASLCGSLAANPPDILVNLAGIMSFGAIESAEPDRMALCARVNLTVPMLLARAVAGPMRARGSGQIVNVGSVLGAIPYPWFAAYSASKAGLAAFSQALRRELAGSGICVTHVNPRAARTAFNDDAVNRFLAATSMTADDPARVAGIVAEAIIRRHRTVSIGRMERLYAILNALAPGLIDRGLAGQLRQARTAFS